MGYCGGVDFLERGTCSICRVRHRGGINLQRSSSPQLLAQPIFSRSPTVLWLVITGDVDFLFELDKNKASACTEIL